MIWGALSEQAVVVVALAGAWLTGEVGRAAMAGAAGGLVRWLAMTRRRLRDGVVSVVVGTLMSTYATPIVLALLEGQFGNLRGDVRGTAGFAAGLMGMSLAKLIMGLVEARRGRGGGDDSVS